MNCYIYAADVYCEKCAKDIIKRLTQKAHDQHGYLEDSGDYPQGPYQDGESDYPQHCGSGEDCLAPTVLPSGKVVGQFLENSLTTEGRDYVLEQHSKHPSEITTLWMEFYGLNLISDSSHEVIDDDNRWAYKS